MALDDLVKPTFGLLAFAATATLGFAAGYMVARDPELLRRLARSLAGGIERVSGAVALSREEFADLWAEARDRAQQAAESEATPPTTPTGPATATRAKTKPPAKKRASKRTAKQARAAVRPCAAARPRARKGTARET
jgi:hypothetical protein